MEKVHPQSTQKFEENWQETLQNEVNKSSLLTDESWDSFLESLSNEEFDAFEKLLTEMPSKSSESGLGQEEVGKQIETLLRENFSPDQFTHAMETLGRYGPKEGLRKLAEEDSEIVTYLRTLPRFKQTNSRDKEEPIQ